MMEYDNTNTGLLFINENASEQNKQPQMTGKLNVDGKDFQIAGWRKESKSGKKFLSLKIQEPRTDQVAISDSNTDTAGIPF